MQFKPKSIDEIVSGQVVRHIAAAKTETRRVVKANELGDENLVDRGTYSAVHSTHDDQSRLRLKWRVGNDYAVQPGRGKPGVWWSKFRGIYRLPHDLPTQIDPEDAQNTPANTEAELYETFGWQPLRIRLLSIRREPLQAITEADAIAEGYPYGNWGDPLTWYRELWESINGAGSWDKTGDVWVLTFEVVK